jgi:hypothetical protein
MTLFITCEFHESKFCGSRTSAIPEISWSTIPIYIQQDETLHSLFHLENALHVSGGTTTHHQEHIQLYLQHLVFVRPLPAAMAADSSNGLKNSR